MNRTLLTALLGFSACGTAGLSQVAQVPPAESGQVIVSVTHPKDSRGETVYDLRDDAQKGAPIVGGVLVPPKALGKVKPSIPMSSRMHHRKLDIVVQGVASANGDMIDAELLKAGEDEALARSVLEAFRRQQFKPGTLDGKPVAVLLQMEFKYNVF